MRSRWLIAGALLLALILVPFALFDSALHEWSLRQLDRRGWMLGAAIAALLALDVFLPIPSSVVAILAGAGLGFTGGTLATAIGMSAGAILGYGLGAWAGDGLLRRFVGEAEMARAQRFTKRFGWAALLLSRPIPVLAEASVVYAGATRMPPARFLTVTTLANLAIGAVYAAIGSIYDGRLV